MSPLIVVLALALSSEGEAEGLWAKFERPLQWSAGNPSGNCTLSGLAGSARDVLTLSFSYTSSDDRTPKGLTLSVGGSQNVWPVRIELADDPAARSFEIGFDPPIVPFLRAGSAEVVLAHLKSGGTVHVFYRSEAGDTGRAVFAQDGFRQSHAMFAACIEEMSPNNALEQTRGQ